MRCVGWGETPCPNDVELSRRSVNRGGTRCRSCARKQSIIDHGDGGILSFEFVDSSQVQEIFDELTALSRSVKPVWMPDDVANADWYVHHLLEVTANNKASKKGVLFRKNNEADVNLFANREVYAIPLDGFTREECLDYLRTKYPAGEVWDIESSTWKEVR